MKTDTIRIGIVGAGSNTRKRHIPGLRAMPGVEIVCVANRTRESGERVARELEISKIHDRWEDVVADPGVDAVCIGTWPNTHAATTIAALEHGKHVLCEARMAMDAGEARRMHAVAVSRPDLVAQLVPAPVSLPVDEALAGLVAEGYVGDVVAVELRAQQRGFVDREAALHWRQDAAVSGVNVLNLGIWYEALMVWVGPASWVMAMTDVVVPERRDERGTPRQVTVPDHVDVLARVARGGLAHMRISAVTGLAPSNEAWIYGTEGTLTLDFETLRVRGGRRGDSTLQELSVTRGPGWRVEEEFVNAVRGKERVARTTFDDGVRYMEFTDAVARSAALGQAVPVPEL